MIKLLHFADVHIGTENYGSTDPQTGLSTRVTDFLHRMDDMIDYAKERDVDLAIFAGDAFKNRNPNPTYQREFAWRILDLAELCPVVLLIGNHDIPVNTKKASSLEIYETLRVPNVLLGADYDLHLIETKAGAVQVGTAPYPLRSRLLEHVDPGNRRTIQALDDLLQEQLEFILRDMATEAAKYDVPRVLTGHFSVTGAIWGSERQVMIGRDVAITLANLADPTWDYIAMGHIHKHQNLTADRDDLPDVVYCGSIERIDFGEEGDDKGFVWVELERGATRWEFVPVEARPFLTLRVDVRRTNQPTQIILDRIRRHDLNDAVVRIIIQTDPESNALINIKSIEYALRDGGCSVIASIQREIEQPDRSRLGPTPEGLAPLELLERYFQSRDVDPARIQVLLEAAENLMEWED